MTVHARGTRNQAVQRGLDLLTAHPGPNTFGSAWNEDRALIESIADLLLLQHWRVDKGLSLLRPEEALQTARDIWIVEQDVEAVVKEGTA